MSDLDAILDGLRDRSFSLARPGDRRRVVFVDRAVAAVHAAADARTQETEDLATALDYARAAVVVPARSVDRIRRALAEGRDIEDYLDDIANGCREVEQIVNSALAGCFPNGGTHDG